MVIVDIFFFVMEVVLLFRGVGIGELLYFFGVNDGLFSKWLFGFKIFFVIIFWFRRLEGYFFESIVW